MFLGELLVYRYQLITKDQFAGALARQREADRGRRVGEILVDMDLITSAQLRAALDLQFSERNPWGGAR